MDNQGNPINSETSAEMSASKSDIHIEVSKSPVLSKKMPPSSVEQQVASLLGGGKLSIPRGGQVMVVPTAEIQAMLGKQGQQQPQQQTSTSDSSAARALLSAIRAERSSPGSIATKTQARFAPYVSQQQVMQQKSQEQQIKVALSTAVTGTLSAPTVVRAATPVQAPSSIRTLLTQNKLASQPQQCSSSIASSRQPVLVLKSPAQKSAALNLQGLNLKNFPQGARLEINGQHYVIRGHHSNVQPSINIPQNSSPASSPVRHSTIMYNANPWKMSHHNKHQIIARKPQEHVASIIPQTTTIGATPVPFTAVSAAQHVSVKSASFLSGASEQRSIVPGSQSCNESSQQMAEVSNKRTAESEQEPMTLQHVVSLVLGEDESNQESFTATNHVQPEKISVSDTTPQGGKMFYRVVMPTTSAQTIEHSSSTVQPVCFNAASGTSAKQAIVKNTESIPGIGQQVISNVQLVSAATTVTTQPQLVHSAVPSSGHIQQQIVTIDGTQYLITSDIPTTRRPVVNSVAPVQSVANVSADGASVIVYTQQSVPQLSSLSSTGQTVIYTQPMASSHQIQTQPAMNVIQTQPAVVVTHTQPAAQRNLWEAIGLHSPAHKPPIKNTIQTPSTKMPDVLSGDSQQRVLSAWHESNGHASADLATSTLNQSSSQKLIMVLNNTGAGETITQVDEDPNAGCVVLPSHVINVSESNLATPVGVSCHEQNGQ